jgi:hypothetical protein
MMLTDDELTTLISSRYADAGLAVTLDAVEHRGRRRRRNAKVALGAGLVAVAVAAVGVTALVNRAPSVPPAQGMAKDCAARYALYAEQRDDRAQLPAALPPKAIDAKHGKAEIILYANPPTGSVKQILFECARTAEGRTQATLTAATALGTPVWGDATQAEYYRDYLPDGSVALVGVVPAGTRSVRVTAANDEAVPVTSGGGYFVAWSKFGTLDLASVTLVPAEGDEYSLGAPVLSGTFNEGAFNEACRRLLHQPNGGHEYVGSDDPVLRLQHGYERAWVYSGASTLALCDYVSTPTSFGASLNSAYEPGSPEMGIEMFVGEGEGWVIGRVPDDATGAQVQDKDGHVAFVDVSEGVFAGWAPLGDWSPRTAVIQGSAGPDVYEIHGTTLTRGPR